MANRKKQTLLVVAGILVLAIALGVSAVFAQADSRASGPVVALTASQPVSQDDPGTQDEPGTGDSEETEDFLHQEPFARHGGRGGEFGRGFGGQLAGLTPMEEVVAESLGVTVEQLQEAHTQVFEALVEENDGDFHGHHCFADSDEFNTLLAEALSEVSGKEITVEAIEAAHDAAREAMLSQLPEELRPSEEQLALMEAQQALKGAIDREAVVIAAAEAVGLDPVAVQDALANRQSLATLLEEAGVTVEEFMAAQQEAQANAIQNAVPEFITQEQADLILESGLGGLHGFGYAHGFDGGHHSGHGGMHGAVPGQGFGGPGAFGPAGIGNAPTTGVSL